MNEHLQCTKILCVFVLLKRLPWLKATVKFVKGVVGNRKMLLLDRVLFISEVIVSFISL